MELHYVSVEGCQHEIFEAFDKDKDQIDISPKCGQAIQGLPRRYGICTTNFITKSLQIYKLMLQY